MEVFLECGKEKESGVIFSTVSDSTRYLGLFEVLRGSPFGAHVLL